MTSEDTDTRNPDVEDRLTAVMARRGGASDGADRAERKDRAKTAKGRADWTSWPAYDGAANGLRNYWYPVYWSAELGRKPVAVTVCGETVMLQRGADGKAYGLHDRCPPPRGATVDGQGGVSQHRHLPLSRLDLRSP